MEQRIIKYTDGLDMEQFKNIESISCYNYNFYVGLKDKIKSDLLLAVSDDDNTTEWYIEENNSFIYFGYSYTTDGNRLNRSDTENT